MDLSDASILVVVASAGIPDRFSGRLLVENSTKVGLNVFRLVMGPAVLVRTTVACGDLGMIPVALTIAGSDPSGGAGLQADLKTFHQHGVYGAAVVTLLTVQNTRRVDAVKVVDAELVAAQIDAVVSDIRPSAVKTGALGNELVAAAVAEQAEKFDFPLVVDPVLQGSQGGVLADREAVDAIRKLLLRHALLVTPNLSEAEMLTGIEVTDEASMREAAAAIGAFGVGNVLVTGGHLSGDACDVLWDGAEYYRFVGPRVETRDTHGTGCVLSAAITARLARGEPVPDAVAGAKRFVERALRTSPGLGRGHGPLNLHADVD